MYKPITRTVYPSLIAVSLLVLAAGNTNAETTKNASIKIEASDRERRNLKDSEDDRSIFGLESKVSIEYERQDTFTLFGEIETSGESKRRPDRDNESKFSLQRGETWLHLHQLPIFDDLGLQIGRIKHSDEREWWWDEELDSIGLLGDKGNWTYGTFVGQELFSNELGESINPEDEDILRFFGNATYEWRDDNEVGLYFLDHTDNSSEFSPNDVVSNTLEDEFDGDLRWIGLSATGSVEMAKEQRFDYWLDVGRVSGAEQIVDFDDGDDGLLIVDDIESQRVSGSALNTGVTWHTNFWGQPWFHLGYARTTGKRGGLSDDTGFRQSGIHDNEWSFGNGVESSSYYGLALEPELSNLQISSLGVGLPFMTDSSTQLIFHDYRQVDRRNFLRGTSLRIDPNGVNRRLGYGADLVLSLEEWDHWEFQFFAGMFRAGEAFSAKKGERTYNTKLKLKYKF